MDGQLQSDRPDGSGPEHLCGWRGVWLSGCAAFRRFVIFLLIVCILAAVGWWFAHEQFGPIVGRLAEQKLIEALADRGLVPRIGAAEFVAGQGIWLRDVTIVSAVTEGPPLIEVDELLLRTDASLWQIVTGPFTPERVLVRHLRCYAAPDSQGEYELARLFPLPSAGGERVPVSIVDASITLGGTVGQWRFEEHVSNLKIDLVPTRHKDSMGRESWSYRAVGELRATRIGHLAFDGQFHEADKSWQVTGNADDLKLSTDLVHAGGSLAGSDLSEVLRLDGMLDLGFAVAGGTTGVPINYRVVGSVQDGRIDDQRLPDPIVDLQGKFEATPQMWELREVRAKSGQGTLSLSGSKIAAVDGDRWTVDLAVDQVSLDPRLGPYLPESVKRYWDEYRPDGIVDAKVHLDGGPDGWKPSVKLTLHDVSMVYAKFPYPVHHCSGMVEWSRERLFLEIEGLASGGRVRFDCDYANPGQYFTGRFQVRLLERIPVGEELYLALSTQTLTAKALRQFSPQGQFTVDATYHRDVPDGPVHRNFVIDLFDGSLRYEHLPYALHRVTGRVVVQDDEVFFRQIKGENDGGYVSCSGSLSADRMLNLAFEATSLSLDDELRKALPAALRVTWDQLRPTGHLDHLVSSYVRNLNTGETGLTLEAQMWERRDETRPGVSVRPTWFPYHWQDLTGTIRYDNGHLKLEDLRGHHLQTTFTMGGAGRTASDGWWLDLHPCSIDRLEPSVELLESLPPSIAQGVRTIDLQGRLNLHGRIVMMSGVRDPNFAPPLIRRDPPGSELPQNDPLELQWDMAVDLQRVGLTIARQRLHDAHGRLDTVGVSIGERVECFGQLDLDSIMWRDSQLLDVRGPVYLDSTRVAIGSTSPQAIERATPQPASAAWLGGRVQLDAQMLLDREYPFMAQASLSEARLELARDEFAMQWDDLAGALYAGIWIEGKGTDPQSLKGHGNVRLRDAAIYEFPLVVNLLKLLSIRQVDRTAFTTSNIDYRIERDRILLDRIELTGDAISLVGIGDLDFDRVLHAQFYTRVGRNDWELPVLSSVIGAASRQILVIDVDGTLDSPTVSQIPFPKINDALQAMTAEPSLNESPFIPGSNDQGSGYQGSGVQGPGFPAPLPQSFPPNSNGAFESPDTGWR